MRREVVAPLQGLARFGPVPGASPRASTFRAFGPLQSDPVPWGCARASLHRLARPPTSTDPLLLLAGLVHFGPSALSRVNFGVCREVVAPLQGLARFESVSRGSARASLHPGLLHFGPSALSRVNQFPGAPLGEVGVPIRRLIRPAGLTLRVPHARDRLAPLGCRALTGLGRWVGMTQGCARASLHPGLVHFGPSALSRVRFL